VGGVVLGLGGRGNQVMFEGQPPLGSRMNTARRRCAPFAARFKKPQTRPDDVDTRPGALFCVKWAGDAA